MESQNAKFLENDVISWSDQPQNLVFEKNHISELTSKSSDRLIVFQDVIRNRQSKNNQLL